MFQECHLVQHQEDLIPLKKLCFHPRRRAHKRVNKTKLIARTGAVPAVREVISLIIKLLTGDTQARICMVCRQSARFNHVLPWHTQACQVVVDEFLGITCQTMGANTTQQPRLDHPFKQRHLTRVQTAPTCSSFTFQIILPTWICTTCSHPTVHCSV